MCNKVKGLFLNHGQNLVNALELCKRLITLRNTHGWSREEFQQSIALQYESLPITLHETAFINVIESQGTDTQRDSWIPRCISFEIIGCYAQTELAHGSNVQGLETTARYDPATQEFVVHSPRQESTKWWIGGMGVLANHALVQAILQLPDDGKETRYVSYGPHLFVVPIRDTFAHLPLPGVEVGDIGPKAYGGFRLMDNGYLHLTHVRIPLKNMLARHAQVSADGKYTPAKHEKLSYGSMVALRAAIPMNMGWSLARAVTVAIRYCISRRQFGGKPGIKQETRVIEYASTRFRLYPLLASSYAYIIAGRELRRLHGRMLHVLTMLGDVSLLPEVHSLSTALKAKSTWDCVSGFEEARKAMGGHGYSHMAGVGTIFANQTPAQTFEGDNYVISQQIARALVKALELLRSNPDMPLPASFSYIRLSLFCPTSTVTKRIDWSNPIQLLDLLHRRAAFLLTTLVAAIAADPEKPWTEHSWTSAQLAAAHADIFVISSLLHLPSPNLRQQLAPLTVLHALQTLLSALPTLLEANALTETPAIAASNLRAAHAAAIEAISIEDAVSYTDAFGFHDWELPGVLGNKAGDIYGRMMETARSWDVSKSDEWGELLRERALEIMKIGSRCSRDRSKL